MDVTTCVDEKITYALFHYPHALTENTMYMCGNKVTDNSGKRTYILVQGHTCTF